VTAVIGDELLSDPLEDRVVESVAATAVPKVSRIEEPPQAPAPTRRVPPDTRLTADDLAKAVTRLRHTNAATRQRVHTLQLVMAGLEGITFEEAARLLDVRPERLAGWLQESESIPKSREHLIADLHEILRRLHQLVPRANTGRWLRLPIPALGGVTPYEALLAGRTQDVLRVTERYTESSFG